MKAKRTKPARHGVEQLPDLHPADAPSLNRWHAPPLGAYFIAWISENANGELIEAINLLLADQDARCRLWLLDWMGRKGWEQEAEYERGGRKSIELLVTRLKELQIGLVEFGLKLEVASADVFAAQWAIYAGMNGDDALRMLDGVCGPLRTPHCLFENLRAARAQMEADVAALADLLTRGGASLEHHRRESLKNPKRCIPVHAAFAYAARGILLDAVQENPPADCADARDPELETEVMGLIYDFVEEVGRHGYTRPTRGTRGAGNRPALTHDFNKHVREVASSNNPRKAISDSFSTFWRSLHKADSRHYKVIREALGGWNSPPESALLDVTRSPSPDPKRRRTRKGRSEF